MYNRLYFSCCCPHCGKNISPYAEFKAGVLDLSDYHIGDRITDSVNDETVTEGYVECDECGKDFWVDIFIDRGTIVSIKIDNTRKGYLS